eukprot:1144943-Pelagomonas_calceolata.AAC.2
MLLQSFRHSFAKAGGWSSRGDDLLCDNVSMQNVCTAAKHLVSLLNCASVCCVKQSDLLSTDNNNSSSNNNNTNNIINNTCAGLLST